MLMFALAVAGAVSAQDVVTRWRTAVHARKPAPSAAVLLVSTSNEDGIPGKVEEWLTPAGAYRRHVTRELDDAELLVTPALAMRRDWNGFVRKLEGSELARATTAVFEAQALAFGPPDALAQAALSESDDHASLLLLATPKGGVPITWFVNAKSGLPEKSTRPGGDSVITTSYGDWRDFGGVLMPRKVSVSETDKPDYQWERGSPAPAARPPANVFEALKPGPSDVHMGPVIPPIPFTLEANHIVLKVQLNGREPLPFILDTGADQQVINTTRLADFGLTSYAKSTTTGGGNAAPYGYAAGATFKLPGVELRNQHVAVLDQSGLEHALGVPLGGILGYDFISRFVVEIDYDKRSLTLYDPATWSYSGSGLVVPVTFDEGIPYAEGAIAVKTKPDIKARFVLDFGAAETMTLTSPFVKANDLVALAGTNANVNRPAGMEKEFFAQNNTRGRVDELRLAKLVVHSFPVNMSVNTTGAYASESFAGTIGEGIFTRYHVFLDYTRGRVILEPTAKASEPYPEKETYGLSLLATGKDLRTYTVSAVRPGSPAQEDGFKKGDLILACDGTPAARFTLADLRDHLAHAGELHELQVQRGNDRMTMAIELRLVSIDR